MEWTQFFLINMVVTLFLTIVGTEGQLLSFLALASLARSVLRPRQSFLSSFTGSPTFTGASAFPGSPSFGSSPSFPSSFSPIQSSSSPYEQMMASSASSINPVMVPPPSAFSPLSNSQTHGFGFPMGGATSSLMSKNMFNSPVTDWSRLLQPSESQVMPSIFGQQYPLSGALSSLSGLPSSYPGLSGGLTSGLTGGLSGLPSFSPSLYDPKFPLGLSSMYPFGDMTGQRKRNFRLSPF